MLARFAGSTIIASLLISSTCARAPQRTEPTGSRQIERVSEGARAHHEVSPSEVVRVRGMDPPYDGGIELPGVPDAGPTDALFPGQPGDGGLPLDAPIEPLRDGG